MGSAGALTVTSNVLDATNTSTATLSYTKSSDINSLTSLGISVNNDGSITFDATSLDSVLNSDYSGVVGLLSEREQLGPDILDHADQRRHKLVDGHSVACLKSNSNIESTLNAEISKEDALSRRSRQA